MHPEKDSHVAYSSRDAGACIGLIVPSRYPNTRPISAPTEYSSSVKRLCQTVVEALPASSLSPIDRGAAPRTLADGQRVGNCDSADGTAHMRCVEPTNCWTRRRECAGQLCAPARGLRHPTS